MLAFGIIMLFVAAVFAVVGFLIFRGKTELIHSYHRENVTDMSGYGRTIGKSVIGIGKSAEKVQRIVLTHRKTQKILR